MPPSPGRPPMAGWKQAGLPSSSHEQRPPPAVSGTPKPQVFPIIPACGAEAQAWEAILGQFLSYNPESAHMPSFPSAPPSTELWFSSFVQNIFWVCPFPSTTVPVTLTSHLHHRPSCLFSLPSQSSLCTVTTYEILSKTKQTRSSSVLLFKVPPCILIAFKIYSCQNP